MDGLLLVHSEHMVQTTDATTDGNNRRAWNVIIRDELERERVRERVRDRVTQRES